MDSRPQSSFIPKKPVIDGGLDSSKGISIFPLISGAIFILTVAASIGIFSYNYYLKKNIAAMNTELEGMQKDFNPNAVAEFARLDKRIEGAKEILGNHISVSSVFKALEALTAKTVSFSLFQFGTQKEGVIEVALEGVAQSYNSVTFQSDIFRNEKSIQNPIFYDLTLNDESNVEFKVKMMIDPPLVLYKNSLVEVDNSSVSTNPDLSSDEDTGGAEASTSPLPSVSPVGGSN